MVDEMGHTVSYREVRTTKYFYFLYKSQHSGRRAKQFLILKAIKMDIKRIFNGCHIPIPHENSTYNTESAHEILIFLNSSVICVILHCKCLQGFTGTLQGNRSAGISNLWGLHVYPQSL